MTLALAAAVVARVVLAAVFLWAGLLKLMALPPARDALAGFGINGRVGLAVGWTLPVVEIVVALALIWPATALAGAVVSLLLLAAFTALVFVTLRRGAAPPCNCFGAISARPIDRSTITRNVVLTTTAVVAVVVGMSDPGPSLVAWAGGGAVGGGLVVACASLAIALIGTIQILRQSLDTQRDLQAAVAALERVADQRAAVPAHRAVAAIDEGLPLGAPAPGFESVQADGSSVTLDSLLSDGRPLLLLSGNSDCGSCAALVPQVKQWAASHRDRLRIVALYDSASHLARSFGDDVLVIGGGAASIAASYRLHWTPGAVLVDPNGRIGSPVAFGVDAIAALVTTATSTDRDATKPLASLFQAEGTGLPIGSRAPDIEGGGDVDRILLFWRASCPHCAGISADVRQWGAASTRRPSTELVVVNWSGEPAGIDGVPVVSDRSGLVSQSFGVAGTPSALLIDAGGRVASAVAVGGPDVLALLGVENRVTG